MLAPGTIVGDKYRLEEPIGQGGMATVWRAVHTTLGRDVAVKFLEAVGTRSQELAGRFLQEAKLAAGLRHRHVVDIVDFGVLDETQPYMVMEYLEGQSLADRYVDGPPVTDWDVMQIVTMTLSGLAAVHDAGILHRDVKPENIFLVEDADGFFPKLLDFGVSRGLGGGSAGRFTKTGTVVGTPQYMSPEQARGKKDLDQRSDLFSVGAILYEGFAGDVPFDSENVGDVLIMVATEPHVPLDEVRPDLPPAVVELVHKALKKRREERYESARQMRDALIAAAQSWTVGDRASGPDIQALTTGSGMFGFGQLGSDVFVMRPVEREVATEVDLVAEPHFEVESAMPGPPVGALLPPPSRAADAGAPALAAHDRPQRVGGDGENPFAPLVADASLTSGALTATLAPPAPRRSWRLRLTLLLAVLLAAGAFAYWRVIYSEPEVVVGSGAMGEVRPGAEVAPEVLTRDEIDTRISIPGPPAEGVRGPEVQLVDVPSPPDPPAVAVESEVEEVAGEVDGVEEEVDTPRP